MTSFMLHDLPRRTRIRSEGSELPKCKPRATRAIIRPPHELLSAPPSAAPDHRRPAVPVHPGRAVPLCPASRAGRALARGRRDPDGRAPPPGAAVHAAGAPLEVRVVQPGPAGGGGRG